MGTSVGLQPIWSQSKNLCSGFSERKMLADVLFYNNISDMLLNGYISDGRV